MAKIQEVVQRRLRQVMTTFPSPSVRESPRLYGYRSSSFEQKYGFREALQLNQLSGLDFSRVINLFESSIVGLGTKVMKCVICFREVAKRGVLKTWG